METPCFEGHNYGSRKPTETSVFEYFYFPAARVTQKPGNSSASYHKTKNPLEPKIAVNKGF